MFIALSPVLIAYNIFYYFFQAYQQNESDSRVSNSSSFSESGNLQRDQDQQLQQQQQSDQQLQQQHQNGEQPEQSNIEIEEDYKWSSSKNDTIPTTTTTTADTPATASSSDPNRLMSASITASAFNSSFLPTVEEERELATNETSGIYFTNIL